MYMTCAQYAMCSLCVCRSDLLPTLPEERHLHTSHVRIFACTCLVQTFRLALTPSVMFKKLDQNFAHDFLPYSMWKTRIPSCSVAPSSAPNSVSTLENIACPLTWAPLGPNFITKQNDLSKFFLSGVRRKCVVA